MGLSFPCALGTQHPSPAFGMEGYNMTYVSYDKDEEWKGSYTVVDKLVVPEDLTPGDYVLSFRLVTNKVINVIGYIIFRWDCEQATQVYNTCANIKIVE